MAIAGRKKIIPKSETNYQAFFEFASDGIFISDNLGNYTDVNEIGLKMLGYKRDELLKKNLRDLIPEDQLEITLSKFSKIFEGGVVAGEQYIICNDGSLLQVEISASVLPNGSIIGMVRDITERKRLDSEINRLNRIYEVISQINQMVVRTNNSEILFSEACRIAIDHGKFRMAWIGLYDEKNNTITPITWSGFEDGYLKQINIITDANISEGKGPTGSAIREGKYFYSNDIANDPFMLPWLKETLKRGYHSSISLPIIIQGKTIGTFNIYASEANFFNEKEIQSLLEVTNNIAFALEKIEDEKNRKAAEETLINSLNSFMGLFNSVSEAIYIQNKEGQFINVNEGVVKMYGYLHEEFIGHTPEFLSAPGKNDLPHIVELVKKVFITGNPESFEFWGKRKNGDIFPKEVICNKGKYFGEDVVIATARDITESKIAKEALKESEEKFHSLFENARDPILLLDETSFFIACNEATVKILGAKSKEQLLPIHPSDLSPEYQPDGQLSSVKAEQMIRNAYEQGSTQFEWVHKKLDGTPILMDISLTVIPIENKNILMVHWRDITTYKKVEEELRLSEERFKSMVDQAADGILLGSNKGLIVGANQQISLISGFSQEELIGKNINMLFTEKELEKSPLRYDLLNSGLVVRNERFITRKDGSLIPIEMNTKKMPENAYYTYQAIIRDNTERLKSEELNRKIEKAEYENKVKSKFLANLSHEIRNPLNAIIGINNTLTRTELNSEQQKYAEAIDLSASNLLNILNDILDFSKIEANKSVLNFENFEFREFIKKIVLLNKQKSVEKGVEIKYFISPDLPDCFYSDKNKIHQIITNLLSNALKFTERGKIELFVELKNRENDNLIVEFTIRDTGIGIEQKNFDKIFQSFTQLDSSTKKVYAGTGLGLSICKNYIEMFGGEISFTSKFDEGSAFTFWIPLKLGSKAIEQKSAAMASSESFNSNAHMPISVLIAEDDGINRLYLINLLRSKGFKVDFAIDGFSVIEKYSKNKYDLILMDGQMPRMDGFEAAQKIRGFEKLNNVSRTNIITISGYSMNEFEEEFKKSEIDDYIIKPINEHELFDKIKALTTKK